MKWSCSVTYTAAFPSHIVLSVWGKQNYLDHCRFLNDIQLAYPLWNCDLFPALVKSCKSHYEGEVPECNLENSYWHHISNLKIWLLVTSPSYGHSYRWFTQDWCILSEYNLKALIKATLNVHFLSRQKKKHSCYKSVSDFH